MKNNLDDIKQATEARYMHTFSRQPLAFSHGEGAVLYDTAGKAYVDFFGGIAVSALGYGDPELTAAIAEQAGKLIHISNLYYTEIQAAFLTHLLDGTIFSRAFLCNSGTEANEGALKLVRKYQLAAGAAKPVLLTLNGSFHGRTLAAATLTGQPKYSAPFAPLPAAIRSCDMSVEALTAAFTPDVGGLFLEIIQGEGGVMPLPEAFLHAAERLCRENGALLVIDEVQTGVGRTGRFFAFEHYGLQPDVVTLAKGIAGGVPMGAILARGEAAEAFQPGEHGSTFGGNPLACAAGDVVVRRVGSAGFLAGIADKGDYLLAALKALQKSRPAVVEVRGKGLLAGAQLDKSVPAAQIVAICRDLGYIVNACGQNTLRFAPPLIITKPQIDGLLAALDQALGTI
ncbi:MAG: acetylornithine/succinylornithine family transaminase [Clostridiales bacterium]|jgi:predicted acetylornithine/succinylornithine family transaminase|nr:acetylornithine/succinylornithine family transaminase [Clostridiales bacterium]